MRHLNGIICDNVILSRLRTSKIFKYRIDRDSVNKQKLKINQIIQNIFFITLFCIQIPGLSLAADDPGIHWYELESAHFIIHFPETRADFARRALVIAEEAHETLSPLLEWTPREKTHIRVSDTRDEANGSSRSTPRNQIELYAYPPPTDSELIDYDDWLRQLVYHEYTHILHTDNDTSRLHTLINAVMGKIARGNAAAPRWYTEGLAVYYETITSNTGRLRNTTYRLMMRQAALTQTIPTLGELSTGLSRWPYGLAYYLFGSFFLQYIASQYGSNALTLFNHALGNDAIPYALNRNAYRIFGKTLDQLYDEWRNHAQNEALADLERMRKKYPLTPHQNRIEPFRHAKPQPMKGGKTISYVRNDGLHGQWIVSHDIHTKQETRLVKCWGSCTHRWSENGQFLYFLHQAGEDGYRSEIHLYRMDVKTKHIEKMTNTSHLRSFALDHDDLYYIQQSNEATLLYKKTVSDIKPVLIYKSAPYEQIDDIAVKNGKIIAVVFDPTTRQIDLAEWIAPTTSDANAPSLYIKKQLTFDKSLQLSPFFDENGTIYYASDASGNWNLWKLQNDTPVMMTNLADGLNDPVMINGDIFYTSYTPQGTTISKISADDLYPHDVDLLPANATPLSYRDREAALQKSAYSDANQTPPAKSKPWRWLLPQTWTPRFSATSDITSLGIQLSGSELTGHHQYQLTLDYLPQLHAPQYTLNYIYGALPWDIQISSAMIQSRAVYRPSIQKTRTYAYQTYQLGIDTNRIWNGRTSAFTLGLGYQVEYSKARNALSWSTNDPLDLPTLPSLGWTSALRVFFQWSNMLQHERAMYAGDGYDFRLNTRFEAPWLGAKDYAWITDISAKGAWSLPGTWAHAIQATISAGGTWAPDEARQPFLLSTTNGGVFFNQSGGMLQTYTPGSLYGRHYLYARVAYNSVLLERAMGSSTLPIGISKLGGSLFSDWGYAWRNAFQIRHAKFDVGAKLDLNCTIGYRAAFNISLAYAYGPAADGGHAVYLLFNL